MSVPVRHFPPRRKRLPVSLPIAGALAMAAVLPVPLLAGPVLALLVGVTAWRTAAAFAPPRAANDNAPLPISRSGRRHATALSATIERQAMFGNGKTDSKAPARRLGGAALSVIGADVTVTGNLATDGDLHIDGTVEGDIVCGSIIQGPSSRIVGTVRAKAARLAGTIEGEVSATQLTVEKSARLRGDASYRTLQIETGAQVDGRMTHLAEGQTAAADTPLRLVDASDAAG